MNNPHGLSPRPSSTSIGLSAQVPEKDKTNRHYTCPAKAQTLGGLWEEERGRGCVEESVKDFWELDPGTE